MAAPGTTPSRLPLFLGLGIVGIAVIAGAAFYMGVAGDEPGVMQRSSTYTEGVTGTWQRVNPLYAAGNDVDQDLSQLVFSGLMRIGPGGEVLPDLANSEPHISADGLTYTFPLREDARWHDGEPFTSRDVVFTVEAILGSGFRGDGELAARWEDVEVEAPDDHTVRFHLPEPSAPFLARDATLGILPAHRLEEAGPDGLFDAGFNFSPVGTGPYQLESLDANEAVLSANSRYHLGSPGIDKFRFRFYPDQREAIAALERGDIDGLFLRSAPREGQLERLESLAGTTVQGFQRAAHLVLYLNNDAAAFFRDPRVRQAIALAVDREGIVDSVFGGAATPSSLPIPPGSWAHDGQYEVTGTDESALEVARELLDEAGWEESEENGVRVRLGSEFRLTIRTDSDPIRLATAQEIAEQLEPLGIRATVASTSFTVLRRDFLQERRYEAAVAGWDQGVDPDPYFAWHSSQMGTAGLNIANYSDPVADRLIEEGRRNPDTGDRLDMYTQFQEVWDRAVPSVVIAYPHFIYAQAEAIDGAVSEFLPRAHLRFAAVHEWRRS